MNGEGRERTDAATLIACVLQQAGDLATTKVAKLVYLVDVAWVQMTGRTLTDLPYIWHLRGPYCNDIAEALERLTHEGRVDLDEGETQDGKAYTLYSLIAPPPEVSSDVEQVVKYVVKRFSAMPLDSLLEYVYETPPMKGAVSRFQPLDLPTTVKRSFKEADALKVMQQETNDTGRRVPIEEVLEAIGG